LHWKWIYSWRIQKTYRFAAALIAVVISLEQAPCSNEIATAMKAAANPQIFMDVVVFSDSTHSFFFINDIVWLSHEYLY
jgi:hypothetical protein